jgi:hypothetical protein
VTDSARLPVVFVLPGLGGEEDSQLKGLCAPSRSVFELVPVTYLEWTDFIETGCDFSIGGACERAS